MKNLFFSGVVLFLVLLSSAISAQSKDKIVVGSKNFTESRVLSHILTVLLIAEGYEVQNRVYENTISVRAALLNGEVDLYWEYTGTAYSWLQKQKRSTIANHSEKIFEAVKRLDYQNNKVLWLNRASLNNTWVLVMNQEYAARNSRLKKMSDFSKIPNIEKIRFGMGTDFYNRPDGFKKLQEFYDFKVSRNQIQFMTHKAVLGALKRGQVHIGMRYATDPEIKAQNFVVLEDDHSFFPVYNPTPVLLEKTAKKYPGLVKLANLPGEFLDNQAMIDLLYQIDIEKRDLDQATRFWLKKVNLLN